MTPHDAMLEALREAEAARDADEVPVGCVILRDGRIVGRGHNRRIRDTDPTAHAEMIALRQAAGALGDWRLEGCTLVVTLEPCPMCAGAMVAARVGSLVYGCDDPKAGAVRTLYRLCDDERLNHRMQITGGVMAAECGTILTDFFRARRGKGST